MRRPIVALFVLAGLLLPSGEARAADAGADAARRARVVARVGTVALTVGEVEDRLAAMPAFQRATFGSTPSAIAGRFVADVMVREALLEARAAATNLAAHPPASYAIERARSTGTIRAIRARVGEASAISMDEVRAYYEHNRDRFSSPVRYQIWRILCKTREEASSVLDEAKASPTPATFSALARDHSLDKGTSLRGGNLGFVGEDGATPEPGLRTDVAVVQAVAKVRDGEFVPAPVAEGEYFAVAWRRGTRPASIRSVAEATAQIRDVLRKSRIREETDKLVARLRAEKVRDLDEAPLAVADLGLGEP